MLLLYNSSGQEAFRWDTNNGIVGLGFLPGGLNSQALGVIIFSN